MNHFKYFNYFSAVLCRNCMIARLLSIMIDSISSCVIQTDNTQINDISEKQLRVNDKTFDCPAKVTGIGCVWH